MGIERGRWGHIVFLSSQRASVEAFVDTASHRTREAAQSLDVVRAQDTTEVNFAGCYGNRGGMGPAGNRQTLGLFVHALVSIDVAIDAVLGLSGAKIWIRSGQQLPPRHLRAPEENESHK
jgi:hypothetical protein